MDDRFDPRKALAATVRYLTIARRHFGRDDLAATSYHMGIGNLSNVLRDYGGKPGRIGYARLYFDSSPLRHARAWGLLARFGDDSSNYYWKLLAAEQIMRLYRSDPSELRRLAGLHAARASAEEVLHPPGSAPIFATADAIKTAEAGRQLAPHPRRRQALRLRHRPAARPVRRAPRAAADASTARCGPRRSGC